MVIIITVLENRWFWVISLCIYLCSINLLSTYRQFEQAKREMARISADLTQAEQGSAYELLLRRMWQAQKDLSIKTKHTFSGRLLSALGLIAYD